MVKLFFRCNITKSKAKIVKKLFELISSYGPDEQNPYDFYDVTHKND